MQTYAFYHEFIAEVDPEEGLPAEFYGRAENAINAQGGDLDQAGISVHFHQGLGHIAIITSPLKTS